MENEASLKLVFWVGTAVMSFSVLGVILIFTIYRNKVHKLNHRESEKLLRASLDSEKKERRRIASELHDSVSGDLTAVRNYLGVLKRQEKEQSKKEIFQEVQTTLVNIVQDIQRINYTLMPPTLEVYGLIPTLKNYFSRMEKWNGIIINEKYDTENISFSSSNSYELYRIIQELVTNMLNHGKADIIDFAIEKKEENIVIRISDNGASFDFYKSLNKPYGMGLKNITLRIKYIGAKLIQLPATNGNIIQIHLKLIDESGSGVHL